MYEWTPFICVHDLQKSGSNKLLNFIVYFCYLNSELVV